MKNIKEITDIFKQEIKKKYTTQITMPIYMGVSDMEIILEEIEKYKDDILSLENERDILKSKLSETKADIHYLLENGESIYIKNKYIRGDNNE